MNFFLTIINFFPILLFFHCLFIFNFKKWLGPVATFYASLSIFGLCLFLNINELYFIFLNGNYFYLDFGRWFFCLDLIDSHLIFCSDNLALITSLLVLFLTSFALYFGIEYMYRDAFINRLLYLLNLFATSVIFLFFCYDFFLIIFAWECIGLFSLLLVNFYSMRIYTIKAALKTFIFSRISDLFMFLAFVFSILFFNSTDLSLIFLQIPFLSFHYIFIGLWAFHFLTVFAFFITLSGVIKAAQFFSHVWLPDAMEAPTPASALIHSSTLVIAGVFLIIRFSLLYEFAVFVNYYLAFLGAITLSFAAITAIFQNDIKKLVAYSTISQIGYLVCGCGFCCYEEVLIYLIIHALNKAFLFVLVGYIVHFFNANTDMRQMGGLYLYSFDIAVLLFATCFNLAGLPYSAGFLGKEFLVFQIFKDDFFSYFIRGCWFVGFFFTPIYMFSLIFIVIFGPKKGTLLSYLTFWNFNFFNFNKAIFNFLNLKKGQKITKHLNYFFQYTIVTARPTVFVLFLFWNFFSFFGEFFFLTILNFSTLSETINSNFFLTIKNHVIFSLKLNSTLLSNCITFFIFFFTTVAFYFLLTLRINFNYFLFKTRNNIFFVLFFLLLLVINKFLLIFFGLLFFFKTWILE